ncbi:PorP/SprF family type IX secretion system membrane protein [Pedobacter boryungensis]|uniref:Type IX secretion system membrane protein PorP/SprF n=1 Tax=Pedobacter boryungensis TaxID=869962 RepID=A0ABX2DAM9_9SPHI|nr:type IX secretion system membrane protein PorP/SprF [Pedobacter boryungensis]NQX31115.1 type IX secretion system membrane protein PorP/SprF [Pedobacter boryungensis]
MKNKYLKAALLGFLALPINKVNAQLNPMASSYYQNQYLSNPSLAGIAEKFEVSAAVKAQWTSVDGAPIMQALTATYGSPSKKLGVGLYLYNESAGLLRRTNIKATYAYHLKLNMEDQFIDFGASIGGVNEWIDLNKIQGDASEQIIQDFNARKMKFESDFGMAFRSKSLTVQIAIPNLISAFDKSEIKDVVDRSLYMTSIGYKFFTKPGTLTSFEPMLTYRGVANYKDLFDVGMNVQMFENKLQFNSIYHNTNSVTVGIGTVYKKQLSVLCQYTTNTSDLQTYSNGEFEIGLKYNIK